MSFAPLLILLKVTGSDILPKDGMLKDFSIENIIKAIFAPVVAVGLMSVGLIMIVIMQKVLQTNDTMIERDTITIDKSAQ